MTSRRLTGSHRTVALIAALLACLTVSPGPLAAVCLLPASKLEFIEAHENGVNGVDGLNGGEAVAISPDGLHVYTAAYFDHAVAVFARNPSTGTLQFVERKKQGEGGVNELRNARNVTVSPDGAYVYAVADLDDSIVTFARNPATGKLTTWHQLIDGGPIDGLDDARGVAVHASRRMYSVARGPRCPAAGDT
jgi:DNA-binding beta-propeller fold protein YncE